MLQPFTEYTINDRLYNTYSSIEKELALCQVDLPLSSQSSENSASEDLAPTPTSQDLGASRNYLFDLSYLGILSFQGSNSLEFLQGQLTCDMQLLSETSVIQGAQCNLKGRLLALMDIMPFEGISMVLPQDLIQSTQKSLATPALLSRVAMQENQQFRVLGFYLQNPTDYLPFPAPFPQEVLTLHTSGSKAYYHLGAGFYLLIMPQDEAQSCLETFASHQRLLGSLTWHTLKLLGHQIDIYPLSRGLFLPHRLGLHLTKRLSFNKGCYKGQEIIARMHYRSEVKHQMQYFMMQSTSPLQSGQSIQVPSAGEIIDYSYLGQHHYSIAASLLKEP